MQYLRTSLATDWQEEDPPWRVRVLKVLLFFVPEANADYEPKMHLVREWFIEFDEAGVPGREIGFDESGTPILAGPDNNNYGFWLDTNMTFSDFERSEVDMELFEKAWSRIFDSPASTEAAS